MMSKAWVKGEYICCDGDPKCANNRLKLTVDTFARLFKEDEDKARNELYEIICNLQEDLDMHKAYLEDIRKHDMEKP